MADTVADVTDLSRATHVAPPEPYPGGPAEAHARRVAEEYAEALEAHGVKVDEIRW